MDRVDRVCLMLVALGWFFTTIMLILLLDLVMGATSWAGMS